METETITIPKAVARRLRAKVDGGAYSDETAVILSGLAALDDAEQSHASSLERWLNDEVLPIALRLDAEPDSGFSADEVLAHLRRDLQSIDQQSNAA